MIIFSCMKLLRTSDPRGKYIHEVAWKHLLTDDDYVHFSVTIGRLDLGINAHT